MGNSWKIYYNGQFPIAMLNDQRINLHFPMVFLWFSYKITAVNPAVARSSQQHPAAQWAQRAQRREVGVGAGGAATRGAWKMLGKYPK